VSGSQKKRCIRVCNGTLQSGNRARQGRDPDIFEAQYLDNRARYMVSSY